MNIAFLCVPIACAMPLLLTIVAKRGGHRDDTPYDNREPRLWLSNLSGWPRRANAAQQNSWEALPIFIAGVLMASHANVPQATLDFWAVWFIAMRVAYAILYIADRSNLRSLAWALALLAPLRLMIAVI
ncbi:MAG: hypothetical protein JWM03_497 [Rhodocyclales bacterium]|nr:hypothetical protein [Rhodocyclales bacterium]MDB5887625.1 hypothetical protein [Rhodocyclales bacterium]